MRVTETHMTMAIDVSRLLLAWRREGITAVDAFVVLLRTCLAFKVLNKHAADNLWAEVMREEQAMRDTEREMRAASPAPDPTVN